MTKVVNLQNDSQEKSQIEPQRSPEIQELYDNWTVSASGLSEFNKSPLHFKAYKEAEYSDDADYFKLGTAIHCRVLEPEEFDNRYYVMNAKPPAEGTNMRVFIDRYFHYLCEDFDTELAKEMAYKESGYKTKFETVWNNFETKPDLLEYWHALNNSKGKIVLSDKEEYIIESCYSSIMSHKAASSLLDVDILDGKTYLTEETIEWNFKGFDFKMKSILDRVVLDTKNKVANIFDLKTTSGNINNFAYSYEKYSYYRQMAMYGHAVMWYIENVLKENKEDWAITTGLIVVETTGFYRTVVFSPAPMDMTIGHREIIDLLTLLAWHYDNNKWEHPAEYYLTGGIMPIALDLAKHGYSDTKIENEEPEEHKAD